MFPYLFGQFTRNIWWIQTSAKRAEKLYSVSGSKAVPCRHFVHRAHARDLELELGGAQLAGENFVMVPRASSPEIPKLWLELSSFLGDVFNNNLQDSPSQPRIRRADSISGHFHSHGGTPSHHPLLDGIFPYKPSIYGYPHLGKPPYFSQRVATNPSTLRSRPGDLFGQRLSSRLDADPAVLQDKEGSHLTASRKQQLTQAELDHSRSRKSIRQGVKEKRSARKWEIFI